MSRLLYFSPLRALFFVPAVTHAPKGYALSSSMWSSPMMPVKMQVTCIDVVALDVTATLDSESMLPRVDIA
eukprot:2246936-Prymnesium_polylepis.1